MKKLLGIIILGLFLAGCETTGTGESPSGWKYPWPQGLNKNEFIDTFFKGKSLTNVEGIYSTNDNRYEFAVIKKRTPIIMKIYTASFSIYATHP